MGDDALQPAGFLEEKTRKYPEVSFLCSSTSGRMLSLQFDPVQLLHVGVLGPGYADKR